MEQRILQTSGPLAIRPRLLNFISGYFSTSKNSALFMCLSRSGLLVSRLSALTVMSMTLSVDHRVIDGALGAEFLKAIVENLENPMAMLA